MAPKVKKSASKKSKKGGELVATDEAAAPFGLKVQDIVRTPVGLFGTVLGVKYEDANQLESGRLWVRYDNGHEAPLELRPLGPDAVRSLGYSRATEAAHVRRDVAVQDSELAKLEEKRKVISEVIRLQEAGLPIPEHLLPPVKEEKPKKGKDGDKDGKKKKK